MNTARASQRWVCQPPAALLSPEQSMRRITLVLATCASMSGCFSADQKQLNQVTQRVDSALAESRELRQTVERISGELKASVDGVKEEFPRFGEKLGTEIDPIGMKELVGFLLEELKMARNEAGAAKARLDKAELEPGVRADIPDFRLVPIGSVSAFAGPKEKLPDNWRLCDGATLKTAEFQELFQAIGTRYGDSGDVTFRLPDYRGLFLRGLDPASINDPEGASRKELGQRVQQDSFASHSHVLKGKQRDGALHELQLGTSAENASKGRGFRLATGVPEEGADVGTIDWDPLGGAETRPKNIAVNWIIRVK